MGARRNDCNNHVGALTPLPARGKDDAVDTDTLIIGASAAGLATAASLAQAGQPSEILEATDVVGTAWRHHYDRLHLHTPKSSSSLPGLDMPRDWPRYPSRDQVVEYLVDYASPETRTAGETLVAAELAKLPDGEQKAELLQRLARIRETGDRDMYF